jgi:hypothetical protein
VSVKILEKGKTMIKTSVNNGKLPLFTAENMAESQMDADIPEEEQVFNVQLTKIE